MRTPQETQKETTLLRFLRRPLLLSVKKKKLQKENPQKEKSAGFSILVSLC
jgi:hypothetical protein